MIKEVLGMSCQELDRLEVLKLVEDKRISQIKEAQQLGSIDSSNTPYTDALSQRWSKWNNF